MSVVETSSLYTHFTCFNTKNVNFLLTQISKYQKNIINLNVIGLLLLKKHQIVSIERDRPFPLKF